MSIGVHMLFNTRTSGYSHWGGPPLTLNHYLYKISYEPLFMINHLPVQSSRRAATVADWFVSDAVWRAVPPVFFLMEAVALWNGLLHSSRTASTWPISAAKWRLVVWANAFGDRHPTDRHPVSTGVVLVNHITCHINHYNIYKHVSNLVNHQCYLNAYQVVKRC